MKIHRIIGAACLTAIVYYSGFAHGATDMADELMPDIKELQEHYTSIAAKNKILIDKLNVKNEQLANPVTLETLLDGVYGKDFKTAKFTITAYSPYDDRNGLNSDGSPDTTATMTTPGPGTFAIDPDVVPYGSKMIIIYPDGTVERGIAEDTGGQIKGHRIDVFRYSYDKAMKFGKQEAVVIWY